MTTLAMPLALQQLPTAPSMARVAGNALRRWRVEPGDETPHELGLRLLAGCLAGEPRARADFALQYRGLVRYACEKVLRKAGPAASREDLDDVCQSALAALFERDCRKLRLYDGRHGASLATFLRVCATRHALDHVRHERRRPTVLTDGRGDDGSSVLDDAVDPAAGPEAVAETRERIEHLRATLDLLTPRERLFLRLHFVEEMELGPVAKVLGLTENAAYVLKSRLRKKLRDRLDEAGSGDV